MPPNLQIVRLARLPGLDCEPGVNQQSSAWVASMEGAGGWLCLDGIGILHGEKSQVPANCCELKYIQSLELHCRRAES